MTGWHRAWILVAALGVGACGDDSDPGSTAAEAGSTATSAATSTGPGATSVVSGVDTTVGATEVGTTVGPMATSSTSGGGLTTTGPGATSTGGEATTSSTGGGASSSGTTGAMPSCGNGSVDAGEQCDGMDLQGFDCTTLGLAPGVLACDPVTCTFDVAGCGMGPGCGNGVVDPGEQCDGMDLQGFDCASLGLGGGVLACDPVMCVFDTSMCMPGGGTGT